MDARVAAALSPYRPPGEILDRLLTPCLLVDLDRVRENLRRVVALLGGEVGRWRPHVKTTKLPVVLAELVALGLRRFKCATPREAAVLLATARQRGVEDLDVLLAHSAQGASLRRLADLGTRHPRTRLSCLVEDPRIARSLPPVLGAFLDLNSGMDRTGIPLEERESMAELVRTLGSQYRGLHYYDGHLPSTDPDDRRREAHAGYDRLVGLGKDLRRRTGVPAEEVVTSGTPAFVHALSFEGWSAAGFERHSVSPGTVVYHDLRGVLELPELDLVPAAMVLSRVISHPRRDRFTADAGSKSIAAEAGDPCAAALGHPEWIAARPSEEHLPFDVTSGERPDRGELMTLVPRHVCPTVNLAEQALIVEGGRLKEVAWVAGRAHEVLLP